MFSSSLLYPIVIFSAVYFLIFVIILLFILLVARWVFRVNDIVSLLEEIAEDKYIMNNPQSESQEEVAE